MRLTIRHWVRSRVNTTSADQARIREAICSAFERVWGGLALLWGANALYLIASDKITPWLDALLIPLPLVALAMLLLGAIQLALAGRQGQRTLLARAIGALASVFCWVCIFICILGAWPTSGTSLYFGLALVPFPIAYWRLRALGKAPQDD